MLAILNAGGPPVAQLLEELLRAPDLLRSTDSEGSTLLENLFGLATQPLNKALTASGRPSAAEGPRPPVERVPLLEGALKRVLSTDAAGSLASTQPAEFARIARELSGRSGVAQLDNGDELPLLDEGLSPSGVVDQLLGDAEDPEAALAGAYDGPGSEGEQAAADAATGLAAGAPAPEQAVPFLAALRARLQGGSISKEKLSALASVITDPLHSLLGGRRGVIRPASSSSAARPSPYGAWQGAGPDPRMLALLCARDGLDAFEGAQGSAPVRLDG